ncbi:hypothetical protein ACFM35_11575 [Microbacterium sp. P01]|uniref:hypothetical protein n=1 Tax=Microbacterium sp. P01 TaxID=3366261 RepID=UPI0036708753
MGIGFTSRLVDMLYTIKSTQSRRIVLIDIENIVGGGVSVPGQVHGAQAAIAAAIVPRADDQIVVACGRFSIDVVGFEWQGARRLVFRAGTNGADLELLDILENEQVNDRFSEIVIVSGDGIFADVVSRLALRADVTVVTRAEACSRRLRMAAMTVLTLDYDPNVSMEAA